MPPWPLWRFRCHVPFGKSYVPEDNANQVVEIVRDPAGQGAQGFEFGHPDHYLQPPLPLGDVHCKTPHA